MDVKQEQSLKRLLKKLSALRATLKNDERNLLDNLVTSPKDEVSAHRWATFSANAGADEVGAHQLHTNVAHPASANAGADEVGAHQIHNDRGNPLGANAGADEVAAHSVTIVFDEDKEEYHLK